MAAELIDGRDLGKSSDRHHLASWRCNVVYADLHLREGNPDPGTDTLRGIIPRDAREIG